MAAMQDLASKSSLALLDAELPAESLPDGQDDSDRSGIIWEVRMLRHALMGPNSWTAQL